MPDLIGDSLADTLRMKCKHRFKVGATFSSHLPFSWRQVMILEF